MRYLGLLFLILLGVSSCGDDDDEVIDGVYRMTEYHSANCIDPSDNLSLVFGENGCTFIDTLEICARGLFNFSDDGMATNTIRIELPDGRVLADFSSAGTYVVSGNIATICVPTCRDYVIDGNQLTVSISQNGCTTTLVMSST